MPVASVTGMRVQVTSCERYRLRVTTWGSGAPPHAVVLPGLSADWRALAPQIRTLRRLGWTVHVIDLPGFALQPSLRAADAHVVQLADYVAKVIEALAIPRALVLGHSLGGGVALHLALRRPELVTGLVLIAPAALGVSLHWIYKLYCVLLLGRLLLRPSVLRASTLRRLLVGSGRRGARRHRRQAVQRAAARGSPDRARRRPLAAARSGGLGERTHHAFPRSTDHDRIASRLTWLPLSSAPIARWRSARRRCRHPVRSRDGCARRQDARSAPRVRRAGGSVRL